MDFPKRKRFVGRTWILQPTATPPSLSQSVPRRCPLPHRCCACLSSAARPAAVAPTRTPEALPADAAVDAEPPPPLPAATVVAGGALVPSLCPVAPPPPPKKNPDLREVAEGAANEEGTAGPLPRRLMSNWGGARRERTSPGGGEPPEEGQIYQRDAHGQVLKKRAWGNQQPVRVTKLHSRQEDARQRGSSTHARRPSP
jgi:hypothetical protein